MTTRPRNNSGDYRHRITWQQQTIAVDPVSGERTAASWVDVGTQWASIRRLSAREMQYAEQIVGVVTHEIACRTVDVPSGVDGNYRIKGPSNEIYQLTADLDDVQLRGVRTVAMVKRIGDGSAPREQGGVE